MGISKHIDLTAEDRRKLEGRGWLYRQPEALRAAVLDACVVMELDRGESAMHLGGEDGGLFGLISGWLDVLISPGAMDLECAPADGPSWPVELTSCGLSEEESLCPDATEAIV
ncbi:hypothetical protein, partial [Salipiger sp. PrR003]|uniref:hypothetical protein n=1 Tax=Salipiger sp. PrR003 TaxID=2706776 RepID=UPI00142AC5F5